MRYILVCAFLLCCCTLGCDTNDTALPVPPVLTGAREYTLQRVELFGDGVDFYIADAPITYTFTNTTHAPVFVLTCSMPGTIHPAYQKQVGGRWLRPFELNTVTLGCWEYVELPPDGFISGEHALVVPESALELGDLEGTYRFSLPVYRQIQGQQQPQDDAFLLPPEQRISNAFQLSVRQ